MPSIWRCAVLVALIALSLVAPVAGAAMVPDPTWVAGLYDGADGDEVLVQVGDDAPGVVVSRPALCGPGANVPAPAAPAEAAATRAVVAAASRAPPLR